MEQVVEARANSVFLCMPLLEAGFWTPVKDVHLSPLLCGSVNSIQNETADDPFETFLINHT